MTIQNNSNGKPRGFAALSPERRKEISQKGGRIAHSTNKAHKWDANSAKEAGKKGAVASAKSRTAKKNGTAPAPKSDKKDPKRMVKVNCSSAAGCFGEQHADKAGDDFAGEIAPKAHTDSKKSTPPPAPAELSGNDDLAANCTGRSGCGSSK